MRTNFQRDVRVPVGVLASVDVAGAGVADAEDAGLQEVLEASGPRVPAETVEGDGMGRNLVPARDGGVSSCSLFVANYRFAD